MLPFDVRHVLPQDAAVRRRQKNIVRVVAAIGVVGLVLGALLPAFGAF
jgi:hypothetical protein